MPTCCLSINVLTGSLSLDAVTPSTAAAAAGNQVTAPLQIKVEDNYFGM